ncbi:MAG: hypothetical protein EOM67_14865 [Spirochaetia bacterium]|nr:hypothetical protein [Spirochaetia bacterium]
MYYAKGELFAIKINNIDLGTILFKSAYSYLTKSSTKSLISLAGDIFNESNYTHGVTECYADFFSTLSRVIIGMIEGETSYRAIDIVLNIQGQVLGTERRFDIFKEYMRKETEYYETITANY